VLFEDEALRTAFSAANRETHLRRSAQAFEIKIANVQRLKAKQRQVSETTWIGRCVGFLKSLYPLAQFSLDLTTSIAVVSPLQLVYQTNLSGGKFHSAKGCCNWARYYLSPSRYPTFGLMSQVLDAASTTGKEFCVQLKRIEYQASRIANNPTLADMSPRADPSCNERVSI